MTMTIAQTTMRNAALMAAMLSMLAAWLVTGGCATDPRSGYSPHGVWSDDIATVHVPIFENETFDRNVEFQLTDALIKEIESRTPFKVAPLSRADTRLTGRIVNVERDQMSRSRDTGLGEEMVYTVTIDFEWTDLRTGRALVRRESFSAHGMFVPSAPTGEPIELGQVGSVQKLAQDIVAEMRTTW